MRGQKGLHGDGHDDGADGQPHKADADPMASSSRLLLIPSPASASPRLDILGRVLPPLPSSHLPNLSGQTPTATADTPVHVVRHKAPRRIATYSFPGSTSGGRPVNSTRSTLFVKYALEHGGNPRGRAPSLARAIANAHAFSRPADYLRLSALGRRLHIRHRSPCSGVGLSGSGARDPRSPGSLTGGWVPAGNPRGGEPEPESIGGCPRMVPPPRGGTPTAAGLAGAGRRVRGHGRRSCGGCTSRWRILPVEPLGSSRTSQIWRGYL